MDKEILRIIIMATGLLIIAGILGWSYLKNKQAQLAENFDEDSPFKKGRKTHKPQPIDDEDDEVDIVMPVNQSYDDENDEDEGIEEFIELAPARPTAPEIIQFSLVARADEGFNGDELASAFKSAGLIYGKLKIFEKLDENRLVDFGVASMPAPGTFPSSHLDEYYTSGIVFFMQPSLLDNPVKVFDNMLKIIDVLATELDGVVWDADRQLLTIATVKTIRQSLMK